MGLRVECHSDRAGRVPHRFGRPGAMHDVAAVVDRWPGNDHCYYRVRTDEGIDYILRYDERTDRWDIHFLDAHRAGAG